MTASTPSLDVVQPSELAAELKVTRQTLADWRYKGIGPAFVKLSARRIVYRRADVAAWLEAQRYTRTDRPAEPATA
jgi:hypothetical protein